ncbi:vasculin-like protein 1 [Rhincodon typus]|uniref:vasculin-like protein 1 n=1 Tax=Rhincodon typus TaxID=259920 RepID=UPI002030E61F|nr:vasculin-like protein 1 [Rhincodon typus]
MAQHDFVPAWLNFPTSQSSNKSSSTSEKHSDHFARGDGRFGVNRRRHNSSDGFFNNGLLRAAGDGWYQPSLLRHDSVDSGVSKSVQVSLFGSQVWKENASWHNANRGHDVINQRGSNNAHRHWNGNFHNRKSSGFQDKQPAEVKEEKKDEKDEKLQFEEEDFPSLNPDAEKQPSQSRPVSTPAGVWGINFSTRALPWGPKYKYIPELFSQNTSFFFQSPSSTTPPIEISTNRLMKLTRVKSDKKSEFLKALKDDRSDEISEHRDFDKLEDCVRNIPETNENGNANGHQHSLSFCGSEKDYLSSSLEAEHRLLKAMGWQECSENDDNFLPLTEDELQEFQARTEQLKKNGFRKNGFQLKNQCTALHFAHWRGFFSTGLHEASDSETSSSTNSDDDA